MFDIALVTQKNRHTGRGASSDSLKSGTPSRLGGKIYHYVYVSSAVRLFRKDELETLLETSRRNNRRAGVTGFLAYVGGNFIQGLEGPKAAVVAKVEAIGRDPRHHQIIPLLEYETAEREFDDWALAYFCHGEGQALPPKLRRLLESDETLQEVMPKHCLKCVLLKSFLSDNR